MTEETTVTCPIGSINKLNRLATLLTYLIERVVDASTVDADTAARFSTAITAVLHCKAGLTSDLVDLVKDNLPIAVLETVKPRTLGKLIDKASAKQLAICLAGNAQRLRAGMAIPIWRGQPRSEWVVAKVTDAHAAVTPRQHIPGASLRLHVLTGAPASLHFDQFFTDAALARMARLCGLRGKREWRTPHFRELVTAYLMLHIPAGESLSTDQYLEVPKLNAVNRKLAKHRADFKTSCPIQSKTPCHFCHVGYDACKRGTHSRTYTVKPCPKQRGGAHSGYVDPQRGGLCLGCQQKQWYVSH